MKKHLLVLLICTGGYFISKSQSSSCPDDLIPKRFMSNGKMGFVDLFDNWKIKPKYFEVSPFENRFAKVRYGNSYGMINCKGEEVVPPEYEELGFFSFGRIWAKDDKGWHLWDSSGRKLTETPFDEYKRASIWHSYAWVNRNEKWQILNEVNGEIICEKKFTTLKLLSDTLSLVSNDNYFGIINHKNCKFKIPESIVHAQKVSSEFIKLRFRNGKYDIINLKGESILKRPYDQIQSAGSGLAKVKLNDKWGLITPRGKEILTIEYDSIRTYHHERLALKKSGKWFFINEKLFPINDSLYDMVSDYISEGAIVKKDNYWSLIDPSGKPVYSDLDSIVYNKGLLFGLKNSKWFLLPEKKENEHFAEINFKDRNEASRVKNDGEWGIYNFSDASWLIAPVYSKLDFITNNKLIAKNDNKLGLINTDGNVVIPIEYSKLEWQIGFRNNLFLAQNDKFKLINEKDRSILQSDYPIKRQGSLFVLRDDKKMYLYELDGDLIFEDKIDSILVLQGSNYFAFQDKGKWGIMEVKGNEIIDSDFTDIRELSDKFIALKTEDFWEIFKKDGGKLINEDFSITEIKETFNNSFIVDTKRGLEWVENTSETLEKSIKDYKVLSSGQIAIYKNKNWYLHNSDGKRIFDKAFTSIDKKNGSEILRSNSKLFQINAKDQITIYLPFD